MQPDPAVGSDQHIRLHMHLGRDSLLFSLFVACAAGFVWFTSLGLPGSVASHFGTEGIPNGFMSHDAYVGFMLSFVVGFPVLLVVLTWLAMASPKARIKLPRGDYWLAHERRAETVTRLRNSILRFGVMLEVFLCYAHWLVVLANEANPARLSESWFIGGLIVFGGGMLVWLIALLDHFRHGA